MNRAVPLAGLLVLLFAAALCLGTSWVAPGEALRLGWARDAQDFVIWNHRLPRALTAAAVGGALGMAGALVQAVIRNPLASPDILGVTQGAGLSLALGLLVFPGLDPAWLPVLAVSGGAAGAAILLACNAGVFSPLKFALSGIALSAALAGATEFLLLTHPVEINTALLALTGSLWASGWSKMPLIAPLLPLALAALPLAKSLDLVALGEESARALGVRTGRVQAAALALAVAMTGLAVAIAGPVGFVGLVAPHVARLLQPGRMLATLPAAAATGAAIVLAADTLGRAIAPPAEIPVGIMTAVIGAPYFLWLLYRMR
ncbi:iron chelate uptake ABC transporter family permease subunit [Poseidonocella sp. HB161398]|uniref:iron chelate uptake ABC transporter family permease subunit n=1 Tax=Poseidonocella sp. HB161398 TaxID=2320855 RepID=UPI0011088AA4|nr:iron chelate uptake ABC transporter family permease subunit [Poseidonocella sp. HB161398]